MFIQKVLPTSYDDSLTYLEMIGKLIHKINEIIDQTNSYEERFGELEEEQAKLRRQFIDDFKKNLRGVLEQVDIVEPDGSVTHVKDIPNKKKNA